MRFSVKLHNEIEGKNYYIRLVRVKPFLEPKLSKMGSVKNVRYCTDFKCNEVYLNLKASEILKACSNNEIRKAIVKKLNKKLSFQLPNLVFPVIDYDIKTSGKLIRDKLIRKIAEFIIDEINGNRTYVNFISPPKIIIRGADERRWLLLFNKFLDVILSYSIDNLLYFIPSYATRSDIPSLIEKYTKIYGSSGIYTIDMQGERFSSGGYGIVAMIMRLLQKEFKEENYMFYLFDHKPRKRSAEVVPSEDLLAFMNGVSVIGPRHTSTPLPKKVVEVVKSKKLTKVFNRDDLLYHPLNKAPNLNEFRSWCKQHNISDYERVVSIYSDIKTNEVVNNLSDEFSVRETLRNLGNPLFIEELTKLNRRFYGKVSESMLSRFF